MKTKPYMCLRLLVVVASVNKLENLKNLIFIWHIVSHLGKVSDSLLHWPRDKSNINQYILTPNAASVGHGAKIL